MKQYKITTVHRVEASSKEEAVKKVTAGMFKPSEFNKSTDTWCDSVSNVKYDEQAKAAWNKILAKPPTSATLELVKQELTRGNTLPKGMAILKTIKAIESGEFKKEFRLKTGQHSQISEFISILKQAVNYK